MLFPPNIICESSTISDGNMSFRFGETQEVIKNRGQFLGTHNISFIKHLAMACDNGETIIEVASDSPGAGAENQTVMPTAEVLFTRETNFALMLLTADCIPASFYDPVKKVIALAHLNRHTIAHALAEKTITFFIEKYASDPKNILVTFGPHIKVQSYSFALPLDTAPSPELQDFVIKQADQVAIDLPGAFTHQLTKAGVSKKNIVVSDSDTATSECFFSHYRSQRNSNFPQGRLATILMMCDQS